MSNTVSDAALQAGAKAIHETLNGKGTWKAASADERSASRHLVRVVLKAVKAGDAQQAKDAKPAQSTPAPTPAVSHAPRVRSVIASK